MNILWTIFWFIFVDVTCYFESDRGVTYNGTVNTVADGTPCKNWKTYNSPHTIYYQDHNYCRNPRTDAFTRPWCYTADGFKTAECSIDVCGKCFNLPLYLKKTNIILFNTFTVREWFFYVCKTNNFCRIWSITQCLHI